MLRADLSEGVIAVEQNTRIKVGKTALYKALEGAVSKTKA